MKEINANNSMPPVGEDKEYSGFMFLPSYRSAYDCLIREGEPELAAELLWAIVSYGTEQKISTRHPRIELAMTTIRPVMRKSHEEYLAKKKKKEMMKSEDDTARRARPHDLF